MQCNKASQITAWSITPTIRHAANSKCVHVHCCDEVGTLRRSGELPRLHHSREVFNGEWLAMRAIASKAMCRDAP